MTFFRNILRSIYFVVVLFFETLINFLTGIDWMVISPFFLLIYYISVKRFSNHNIIPLVISGLSYDIFLSENMNPYPKLKLSSSSLDWLSTQLTLYVGQLIIQIF